MNQENRKRVLTFLNGLDETQKAPLSFYMYDFAPILHSDDKDIDKLVMEVLDLSKICNSLNTLISDFVCYADRWRSCLDIWRHVIYKFPNVEIFDVMHSLYRLFKIKIDGQFCTGISRRTFKSISYIDPGDSNLMFPENMLRYAGRETDEFNLVWYDWEDI